MITKESAEWLERHVEKYPQVAMCAKCLGSPKLKVTSDGCVGTAWYECSNADCANRPLVGATNEDASSLVDEAKKEWNRTQREIIRIAAKKK